MKADFSIVRGRRVLIALSGGADSVALTVLLSEARQECGLALFAAHLDHGIRPESGEDAEFCRTLCEGLDIPFYLERADIPAEAAAAHAGLESLARLRRHAWLEACRVRCGADVIALAHHMDDQAETVLMHLGRGAGTGGLGGMRTLSGRLYRPLLGFRKAELVEFLVRRGYGWREDGTNRVDDNPRNALRLHVIPELEKCYPQFVRAAARCAMTAQLEGDYLDAATDAYLDDHRVVTPLYSALDVSDPPHRAILRRALRACCPEALEWEAVNRLEALCAQGRGKLDLSSDHLAERTGRRLYFVRKRAPAIGAAALRLDGRTRLPGIAVLDASPCAPIPVRDDPLRQALNRRALEGAVVRTRRAGDRIRPLGAGDKLLSDYLIDRKVDRPLRDALALVAVGSRVHWVCGVGISQEAAISGRDEAVMLKCTYEY